MRSRPTRQSRWNETTTMQFIGKVSLFYSRGLIVTLITVGIRRAILSGDIDQALEITRTQFPTVLAENPDIVFRLKCRKWIELISKTIELNTRKSARHDRRSSNGVEKSGYVDDDFAQDMELDCDSHTNGVGNAPAND